jgi:thiamine biosynthesis lipoprotein ApbE
MAETQGSDKGRVKLPTPIKLRKNRRTTFTVPAGGTVTIIGQSTDGKPAVLVELPDDATIRHEILTTSAKAS